ncbi:MAG: DUF5719 family protein [Propionibacteriaceae bacterium]|nr:DUF5719 family protein [Propionibacteriaceae bacterium]
MNPKRILISLAAFLLIAGVTVGLSLLTPARKLASAAVDLPRITRLTCLQSGDAYIFAPGAYNASAAKDASGNSGGFLFTSDGGATFASEIGGPFTLRADSLAVAGVYAAGPVRTFAPCAPASAAGTILVTDPGDAELIITNSDANEAIVDLTLLGPDGEIPAVGARGIAVAPGVTRRIALSVLAPEGPVGVSFSASQGRVAMAAVNVEGRAARFIGTTRPGTDLLIGGVPPGAPGVQVIITNPFEERADITVSALGATSTYELSPTADLSVEPMSTVAVDLGDALGGEASAIRVQATQEISAGVVVSGATGSPATLLPSEPAAHLAATTQGGAVQLSNPGSTPIVASIEASETAPAVEVRINPGTTVVHAVPVMPTRPVTVDADGPVVASTATTDATGTIIIPLGQIVDDPREPGSTELSPHLR